MIKQRYRRNIAYTLLVLAGFFLNDALAGFILYGSKTLGAIFGVIFFVCLGAAMSILNKEKIKVIHSKKNGK